MLAALDNIPAWIAVIGGSVGLVYAWCTRPWKKRRREGSD